MKYAICTENLKFSYSKTKREINNLSIEVPQNSIYGFLGPNGSGKTTTIKLILGLLKNKDNNIYYNDVDFKSNKIECLSNVGALIETPSLYEHLSARDNLRINARYRRNIKEARINEVLDIVSLKHVARKKVKTFSLGMKQRLGIALALLSEPSILILDEPTNGLDPNGIHEIRNLIIDINKRLNTTILISSHLLSEIEKLCTYVGILNNGELLFQDKVSVLKKSQSRNIVIEVETDNINKVHKSLKSQNIDSTIVENKNLNIALKRKSEIPDLINKLILGGATIYQVKIKNSLEDLFLTLTND
ncbi:ABC transporter ATP-binding protein [Winogradskyella sp.]|uniref:ABC transporter ATP-binding protein n=1 Tax=Winogradskyella sp. TaxID=1883156 RepID=UPI003BAB5C35